MGDVGSLALGGAMGTVAVLVKQELLLPFIGGIFVVEALSVILQVGSFKIARQTHLSHGARCIITLSCRLEGIENHRALLDCRADFRAFALTTLKLR